MKVRILVGASCAIQWYWPPEVGALHSLSVFFDGYTKTWVAYIDAISAIVVKMAIVPSHTKR